MAQHKRAVAVRTAKARTKEIFRLLAKLSNEVVDLDKDASWPAVGSLGHIEQVLAELAGERG